MSPCKTMYRASNTAGHNVPTTIALSQIYPCKAIVGPVQNHSFVHSCTKGRGQSIIMVNNACGHRIYQELTVSGENAAGHKGKRYNRRNTWSRKLTYEKLAPRRYSSMCEVGTAKHMKHSKRCRHSNEGRQE